MKHRHVGTSFETFLEEEGISAEVAARAAKKAFAYQLHRRMKLMHKKKSGLRRLFRSSSTTERLFNDHTGISLETMAKAARYVDCRLTIRLIGKAGSRNGD
ncbi:MAG: hypothetical protein V1495_01165 [Pseudomonadota bacterium]